MWPFKKPEVRITYYEGSKALNIKILLNDEVAKEGYIYYNDLAVYNLLESENARLRNSENIWHILGMMPSTDATKIEAAYRRMAKIYHPDHGGTAKAFQLLTKAKEAALAKGK